MGSADDVINSAAARGMLLVFPLPKVGGAVGASVQALAHARAPIVIERRRGSEKWAGWVQVDK